MIVSLSIVEETLRHPNVQIWKFHEQNTHKVLLQKKKLKCPLF